MSTQITFVQRAPEGHVFGPGCFDSQLGQDVPFTMGSRQVMAKLVYADVLPSGEGVKLTLNVPDDAVPQLLMDSLSLASEDS